ncbi:hypothetical protein, partial [Escherichia coli]|uniref:hypothetical protein n=1 Tax=Escherichia coli TaxID=562 RepID=UPI001BDC4639
MGQLIGEQAAKLELKVALKKAVPTIVIKTLSEAADEGLSSQLSANMGVRFNANEHQDLTQGVMSSAAFGGFLGHTQGHIEAYTS